MRATAGGSLPAQRSFATKLSFRIRSGRANALQALQLRPQRRFDLIQALSLARRQRQIAAASCRLDFTGTTSHRQRAVDTILAVTYSPRGERSAWAAS